MEIRRMTIDDYSSAYSLWERCEGMGISVDDTKEGILKFLDRNPTTCFAAFESGELAGTVLCGHDGRRGSIYHMAVKREARREGTGRALLAAAADALRKEGIRKVSIVVFKDNVSGNAFWDSQGFYIRDDLWYRDLELDTDK